MTNEGLKKWRVSLGLTQQQAATRLGMSLRAYRYYESGERDGRPMKVTRVIELATRAISAGLDGDNQ